MTNDLIFLYIYIYWNVKAPGVETVAFVPRVLISASKAHDRTMPRTSHIYRT